MLSTTSYQRRSWWVAVPPAGMGSRVRVRTPTRRGLSTGAVARLPDTRTTPMSLALTNYTLEYACRLAG